MASFNPDPQVSELQARDQTGASRGIPADRSFETLFSGLGDLIGGAAKTVDTAITDKIETDARYGFEALNDEVGMSTDTVPAGLTQSSEGLQKLALAHQQGKVTQEYYYQRLASTLKGLRTKYPGYEKEVDNIVQTVTGTRPANAFRDALFANIEAQQRAAATSAGKWDSWTAQKENSEVLGVLYPDYFTNPEKYASDEAKNQIRANVSTYQGRIRLAEDTVKLQSSDKAVARPQIGRLFSTISNGYIVGGSEAAGIDSPNVQNMLQTALSDGTIDQTEKENILGLLAQVKAKAQVDMRNRVASSDWGSNFNSQEINEEIKNALSPIEEMEALVTSDNVSAAVRIAERNKAVTDQATADLYQKFPELGPASAVRNVSQVVADKIVLDIVEQSGSGVDFINKVLGKDLISAVAGGQVSLSQVTNRITEAQGKTAKEKQAILSQVLDGTTSILAAPDATPAVKLSTVRSVYSDKLDETWAAVDDSTGGATGTSQRFRLYNKMFNPEITKQVAALNDPEALRMYTAAAVDKFQQIPEFRRAAATLNQDLPYNRYTKVEYDPDRNRLVFMVNREALRNTGFFSRTSQAEDAAAIGATVDKINQALNVVVPIIEANGADETEGVTTLFRDLNLDLNGGKQTGFWGHVYQALDSLTAPVGQGAQEQFREGVTDPEQTGEFEEVGSLDTTQPDDINDPILWEVPQDVSLRNTDLIGEVMAYAPQAGGNRGSQAIQSQTRPRGRGLMDLVSSNKRGYTPDLENITEGLRTSLTDLQASFGKDLPIVSGYRDPARNKRAGGASKSRHMHGDAVDIDVSNLSQAERIRLIQMARSQGFGGVGIYPNSIHLDKGAVRAWGPSYRNSSLPKWARAALEGNSDVASR